MEMTTPEQHTDKARGLINAVISNEDLSSNGVIMLERTISELHALDASLRIYFFNIEEFLTFVSLTHGREAMIDFINIHQQFRNRHEEKI
jgi:hypothetical protein